ncbi:helix-turn-helix domain-containing protein [Nocardia crassostreae]|uniref:helix-turn-helix domain-containing protein n=1 Tax=Nocardia crassostreae TaxID=53428 RepID=UPI00082EFD85|nr:helix-turn-helix transcriptional regulator [Nocardia crassostreae]
MAGSTLASRALGRLLAQYRKRAGLTVYAAAQVVETSQQTLGRVQDGVKSKVPQLWINALADAYGVGDDERRVLIGLAQELSSSQKNWWRAYADEMNPGFDHYMGLEQAARKYSAWRVTVVPGLLQTVEYRRAITWTESPGMPPDQVNKRLDMAVGRQARIRDTGYTVDVILSESVLRDRIGGPGVMADQLRRLAEDGTKPNVSVRVVPFESPGHLGSLVGSFVLLEFPKLPSTGLIEPPVVFVEGYAGDLYLEREGEVKRYREALAEISRVALSEDASRQLVLSIAKEYGE